MRNDAYSERAASVPAEQPSKNATALAPITVSIVEDERQTAEILARAISETEDMRCLSIYRNGKTALAHIPLETPDVALIDLHLPKLSGTECVRALRVQMPNLKIIVLTKFEDSDHIFPALKAGANGYLLKKQSLKDLIQGVYDVYSGGAPMSTEVAFRVVDYFHQKTVNVTENSKLTPRERQVLDFLAEGCLYKEVAAKLDISMHTVNTHIKKIYEKLHVHSRAEAVAKCVIN